MPKAAQDDAVIRTVGVLLKFKPDQEQMVKLVTGSLMNERFDTSVSSLVTKTLATVILGILTLSAYAIYTAIMDIVDVSCADADEKECNDLIMRIFSELKVAKTNLADMASRTSLEIDLGIEGKYCLEDTEGMLTLIRCNDGEEKVKMARFPCTFNHVLVKLDGLQEEIRRDSENDVIGVRIVESNNDDRAFENHKADIINLTKIVRNPESDLDAYSLNVAIRDFCNSKEWPREFRWDSSFITTDDFVLHTHMVQSVEEAKQRIREHRNGPHKNTLALIPYRILEKGPLLKEHMKLLLVTDNETLLVNPSWVTSTRGFDKGTLAKGLCWQRAENTTNCSFYIYFLLKELLTASLHHEFSLGDDAGNPIEDNVSDNVDHDTDRKVDNVTRPKRILDSAIVKFVESLKRPNPEDIRIEMHRIHEQSFATNQEI
jgi:hypothetical protein